MAPMKERHRPALDGPGKPQLLRRRMEDRHCGLFFGSFAAVLALGAHHMLGRQDKVARCRSASPSGQRMKTFWAPAVRGDAASHCRLAGSQSRRQPRRMASLGQKK